MITLASSGFVRLEGAVHEHRPATAYVAEVLVPEASEGRDVTRRSLLQARRPRVRFATYVRWT